ncbi:MAG TPA: ABC transporter ATP-binding protein [Acidimicrobiia bacterium]|nr:ABC transporter ATP-binding protein [Acidimicrobiia bacterium]
MSALSLTGVTVMAGGGPIAREVGLDVEPGSFVGIVGPNGAGKTTVLHAVVGVVESLGRIEIGGRPVEAMSRAERARAVALVPQRPVVPPGMTVADYVLLGRTPHLGLLASESVEDLRAAETALQTLDVTGMADRMLSSLSGGEVQRVVLARALAQGSPLLLLDEPTAALDVGHAQRVLGLVDEMRRSCGLTVVAAIHDLTLAAQFCDRLVMMAAGSVVAHGRPVSVLTESTIRDHYGATVRVLDDGDGRVVVIPIRASEEHGTSLREVR